MIERSALSYLFNATAAAGLAGMIAAVVLVSPSIAFLGGLVFLGGFLGMSLCAEARKREASIAIHEKYHFSS